MKVWSQEELVKLVQPDEALTIMDTLWSILFGSWLNVAVVLLVAPLFEGVLRKVTARIQSRQGPPVWQPTSTC